MSLTLKLVLAFCCTALPWVNGATQKMIVIGGWSAATWTETTVEVYDFDAKTWSKVADLPHGRRGLGAATVGGLVYAVGGFTLAAVAGGIYGALSGLMALRITRVIARLVFFLILAPVTWIVFQAFVLPALALILLLLFGVRQ